MEDCLVTIKNKNNNYTLNIPTGITVREFLNKYNEYRNINKIEKLYNEQGISYYLDYLINSSMDFYIKDSKSL